MKMSIFGENKNYIHIEKTKKIEYQVTLQKNIDK